MSTSRITFGAVLSTIQSTANAATSLVDTANAGIGMLSSFVAEAADNQRVRQIADREDFLESLIREKSMERSASTLKIAKFMAQSEEHAEAYTAAYNRYSELLRTKAE